MSISDQTLFQKIVDPGVLKSETKFHVRPCFTVNSEAHQFICFTLHLAKVNLASFLLGVTESFLTIEIFYLLSSGICYLC